MSSARAGGTSVNVRFDEGNGGAACSNSRPPTDRSADAGTSPLAIFYTMRLTEATLSSFQIAKVGDEHMYIAANKDRSMRAMYMRAPMPWTSRRTADC